MKNERKKEREKERPVRASHEELFRFVSFKIQFRQGTNNNNAKNKNKSGNNKNDDNKNDNNKNDNNNHTHNNTMISIQGDLFIGQRLCVRFKTFHTRYSNVSNLTTGRLGACLSGVASFYQVGKAHGAKYLDELQV